MMGVERVDSSSSTKAAKNNIDRGVAGRSIVTKDRESPGEEAVSPETALQDSARCRRTAEVQLGAQRGWEWKCKRIVALVRRKRLLRAAPAPANEGQDGMERSGDACNGIGTATERDKMEMLTGIVVVAVGC